MLTLQQLEATGAVQYMGNLYWTGRTIAKLVKSALPEARPDHEAVRNAKVWFNPGRKQFGYSGFISTRDVNSDQIANAAMVKLTHIIDGRLPMPA